MKKTLLAAALLAGFAGAAQAETSVVLYGIYDAGLGVQQIKGTDPITGANLDATKVGMLNGVESGSSWGLRGTEDLGDGLRAMFNVESGFNSANGSSAQNDRLFGRRATVGLGSDSWGRIDFGRQMNLASQYLESIDPFALGFGQANMGTIFSAANAQRYDNTVVFQTPMFNDFQFGVGYSFNADDKNGAQTGYATADNTRAITAGLRYSNGPFNVALTYDQLNASNNFNSGGATPKQWILGGSYDFEVAKLALAFSQTRDGWFASQDLNAFGSGAPANVNNFNPANFRNAFADKVKVNSYMVGLTAPLGGASKVFASWLMADPNNVGNNKWQIYSLGYSYDFSKRTDMYAMASYSKNYFFADDLKSTVVGLGVRHRF
jgi:predicted porin